MGARGAVRQCGDGLSPPLRLVIGFSEGSASHDAALAAAPRIAAALGRKVEFEFIHGKTGVIAARHVAALPPDGNVFLICTMGTHALQPALGRAGYDPLADFTPVALLMAAPMVAAAAPSAGIASLDALRHDKRRLRFSSSAIGGGPHLAGLLFARETGLDLHHALYSDTRKLYADLEAGLVELSFNNLASMAPRVASGRLVGLAATGAERAPELPGLPTMAEAGLAGATISNWVGLVAPRGTDAGLCVAIANAVGSDPAAFAAHLAAEQTRWRDVGALLANAA